MGTQALPLDGVAEELGITAAEADAEDDSDFEDDAGALQSTDMSWTFVVHMLSP
jgi:hypothetical protein